ncbi:winged helix-turn-helix domain-containing protein [Parasphingopyxis marina]|uniref:Winged helix-turn-helix transcriptional regulator n=1 Tax=Parasphingopyxis marina TaxID=2761622 RepID=A0A842HVJ1_9SPHN|nr:winged helix-turn-helix domain-containing protein [Parasphingopyxis marina]MBC2777116.1 winged helix-turn-helix transcriptional regulator [Parasphingopyxis marina]
MGVGRFELGTEQLKVDLLGRAAVYRGERIALCPRELDLLAHLLIRHPATVSRAELLRAVCRLSIDPGTNVVEVHLCRLRAKLARRGAGRIIETVRGEGYRLAMAASG